MNNSGIVFQMSSLIILTGLIRLIYSVIQPLSIWSSLRRRLKYKKNQTTVENKFQISLNR